MLKDFRYALRALRKTPTFTIIALVALALGIGANTAIFSVVNAVLLRPLPFNQPGRLVQLNETYRPSGVGTVSYPTLQDWRHQNASFEAIIAYQNSSMNLQGIAEPERLASVQADRGLFRMLGVEPIMGRTFLDDDPPNVAVLGEGIWKRRFGGDPSLVGKKITLDGEGYTVIGIMPADFQFPYRASYTEVWVPYDVSPQNANARGNHYLFVAARLKPAATLEAARNEMDVIAHRLEQAYPDANEGRGVKITPLAEVVTGPARNSLLVLLGAVGLVLLVACANVANLLLARAAARNREVAIRAALGATRLRLVSQFLAESLLLALAGGALGIGVAWGGVKLLLRLAAGAIPRYWEIGLDWKVFAFLLGVCVITGVAFGIVPALAAARSDVQKSLKEAGGRASVGRAHGRFRDALVVAEVGLAFVLLIGAGLLLRAFINLESTPTGIQAENVLTMHLTISQSEYSAPGAAARYYKSIEDRIRQIPAVSAAGFIQFLPLQDWGRNGGFVILDRPAPSPSHMPLVELRFVTPGYFEAMGIPILKGRNLNDHDTADAGQYVCLINDALARKYFPNEDPLGKGTNRGTIVGVVGNVRQTGLARPPEPEIYFAVSQHPQYGGTLVVSAAMAPETMVSAVRAAVREVNPNQALFAVKPMQRVISDSLASLNLYMWLLGLFAALALILAVAGIYGVISYAVTARTQEFGIRVALGADSSKVLGLVLRHGAVLVAFGLMLGVVGALALTGLLKRMLFGVTPSDPATFVAVGGLLAVVALIACLVPALRATKVDPVIALRCE